MGAAERKLEIFQAAARIFHEKGYEQTTMQDIAEAVGMLKGSLYHYIQSKEHLLYEITYEAHKSSFENLRRVRELEGTSLVRIRGFVLAHVTFNIDRLAGIAVFFHDFRALTREHRAELILLRKEYEGFLRQLIDEGRDEGTVCPEIDAKIASFGILGLVNWIYLWYDPEGRVSPPELADAFADFVIAGLECDPGTHRPGHRTAAGAISLAGIASLKLGGDRRDMGPMALTVDR